MADENGGLIAAETARRFGFTDSTLARLVQRGRIERTARGVFRIPFMNPGPLAQYLEAVMWAKAHSGPQQVAISHVSALAVFGISDANPASIHLTVPKKARLRRETPRNIVLHHGDLPPESITIHEGIPVTTVPQTVFDLQMAGIRVDLIRQAVADARKEGFIDEATARHLRRRIEKISKLQS